MIHHNRSNNLKNKMKFNVHFDILSIFYKFKNIIIDRSKSKALMVLPLCRP